MVSSVHLYTGRSEYSRSPSCICVAVLIPRRSLAFHVEVAENLVQKIARIAPMLQGRTGPAIIYVTLQKQADEVANLLKAYNLDARRSNLTVRMI